MRCEVMGIVNVTPDSFSDGGKYFTPEEAVRRVRNLVADGADIIDLGAESTRPGATPLTAEEEWSRLAPVFERLNLKGTVPSRASSLLSSLLSLISVDTYHPETARRALAAGAGMINCVYPEPVEEMFKLCAEYGAKLVFPAKSLGTVPDDLMGTVPSFIDPMIGFGTTREEDIELLRSIPELAKKGKVLVGASRKRIVKKLTGEKMTGKNLGGNLAIAVYAAMNGASAVRVHDVKETVQALRVVEALRSVGGAA